MRAVIVMPVATARGGAEMQLQQLVEQRATAGLELTIAFLCDGPMVDWCRTHAVDAVVIDAERFRNVRALTRSVKVLAELTRRQRADIVIGWMGKGQLYGGMAARVAHVPSVWLQVGLPQRTAPIDRLATLLPARSIITVSRTVDAAQRELLPKRATTVVYPAVDTERFDAARLGATDSVRRRLCLPEDGLIFGSVGRLNSWKGFHVLLDAVPDVIAHRPDASMVLVGGRHDLEPAYADEIHARAADLGLNGKVRLVGHQSNPEEWMQAMDVFVHTSDNEPFGMVVIEAMALGKAVVAGAQGGPAEIITPGVDGLLAPFGDHRALGAAILRFLDDAALRRRLGDAARRRAQDFAVERFAERFAAALAAAIYDEPAAAS